MNIYQIKISLLGSKPKIWRRLLVPSTILLPDFHTAIQIAMGWNNDHLHQFIDGNQFYGVKDVNDEFSINDYKKTKLSLLLKNEKDKFKYEYDFGDSWIHDILLEKILPANNNLKQVVCLDGKMNCPPEDSGGIWGYGEMLEILKQPTHKEYESNLEWLGEDFDPEYFNIDTVNNVFVNWLKRK